MENIKQKLPELDMSDDEKRFYALKKNIKTKFHELALIDYEKYIATLKENDCVIRAFEYECYSGNMDIVRKLFTVFKPYLIGSLHKNDDDGFNLMVEFAGIEVVKLIYRSDRSFNVCHSTLRVLFQNSQLYKYTIGYLIRSGCVDLKRFDSIVINDFNMFNIDAIEILCRNGYKLPVGLESILDTDEKKSWYVESQKKVYPAPEREPLTADDLVEIAKILGPPVMGMHKLK